MCSLTQMSENFNAHLSNKNRNNLTEAFDLYYYYFTDYCMDTVRRETNQRGSVDWTVWEVWTLRLPDFICLSDGVKRAESDGWKGMWRPGNLE